MIVSLALLVVCSSGCGQTCEVEDVREQVSERAGDGATNCGDLDLGVDATAAYACAHDAFRAGTPFRFTQGVMGRDSRLVGGWARSPAGELFYFAYDSDRSGGGRDGGAIHVQRCDGAAPNESTSISSPRALFACPTLSDAVQTCGD